jgi:hypothetical protein
MRAGEKVLVYESASLTTTIQPTGIQISSIKILNPSKTEGALLSNFLTAIHVEVSHIPIVHIQILVITLVL